MSQANPTDSQATVYAEIYVLYGDQSRAFRVAFPKSKCKAESIHPSASKFHKIIKVQTRIGELREISKKQTEEDFSLSVSQLKKLLATAAAKGLKDKLDAQGNKIAINISGAVAAISEINRMDGNHEPTKIDNTGVIGIANMSTAEYKKARAEMLVKDDC